MDTESEASDGNHPGSDREENHELHHSDIGLIQRQELSKLDHENSEPLQEDIHLPTSENESSEGETLRRRVRLLQPSADICDSVNSFQ